jgi:hypothetical protein
MRLAMVSSFLLQLGSGIRSSAATDLFLKHNHLAYRAKLDERRSAHLTSDIAHSNRAGVLFYQSAAAMDERCKKHKLFKVIDDAFRSGDLKALKAALDGFPSRELPFDLGLGYPLEYAIYWSPLPFIAGLIDEGADPNYPDGLVRFTRLPGRGSRRKLPHEQNHLPRLSVSSRYHSTRCVALFSVHPELPGC